MSIVVIWCWVVYFFVFCFHCFVVFFFFFFQAEDGIRDHCVTGVQTCALPISLGLVTPQFLARNRRYALAIAAVAAALLAPPDALSMLAGIVLLMALYEVSIGCAWVVTKRRARREQASRGGAAGLVALLLLVGGSLDAQTPLFPRARPDTTPRTAADSAAQGRLD